MSSLNCYLVDPTIAASQRYDVVVVGSGIAGAMLVRQLADQGHRILIIEAGVADNMSLQGFQEYVQRFQSSSDKHPNSPFPKNQNVPSPTALGDYFVEAGPMPLGGSYTRAFGGTTLHWEGKALRMLREDLETSSRYGVGLNWPITYDELLPYYDAAEFEIGVSGDAGEQRQLGVEFQDSYVYPMQRIPPSYLDEVLRPSIDGMTFRVGQTSKKLQLTTYPQARNGIVHPGYRYRGGRLGYTPSTAVHSTPVDRGQRCQGNANCVPLCPVQAKYDARKTLARAVRSGRVDILDRAIASRLLYSRENGHIVAVEVRCYESSDHLQTENGALIAVRGSVVALATNAIENARLMLASQLPNRNGLIGCYLMDHPYLLTWGLMPCNVGAMRGPLVTSGIGEFRSGEFRSEQAAFAADIHNDGWAGATGSPYSDLEHLINVEKLRGRELRDAISTHVKSQLMLAFMCEIPALRENRVTIGNDCVDALGNPRPRIHYRIPDYSLRALSAARDLSRQIFAAVGARDFTHYSVDDPAYVSCPSTNGSEGLIYHGGCHFSGTHCMGLSPSDSVCNQHLQVWDHPNLYALGSGSMPSIGTSNTSLTIAALSLRAADHIHQQLQPSS